MIENNVSFSAWLVGFISSLLRRPSLCLFSKLVSRIFFSCYLVLKFFKFSYSVIFVVSSKLSKMMKNTFVFSTHQAGLP